MERLPEPLTCFKDFIEADLRRAARLLIKVQDEIEPQWRIASPGGDWQLVVTLPRDEAGRREAMRVIKLFMAWKQAVSFIVASEVMQPDCLSALGVSHGECHACAALITRQPSPWTQQNFGAIEWLPKASIGQDMLDMLPRGAISLRKVDLKILQTWFGSDGRFPAINLATGMIGA